MKDAQYWFTLFAVAQGAFVLGLLGFIILYFLPKLRKQLRNKMRWYIVMIGISYVFLTVGTIVTASSNFYEWGSIWYWLVTGGYLIGDVFIILVFREAVKITKIGSFLNHDSIVGTIEGEVTIKPKKKG